MSSGRTPIAAGALPLILSRAVQLNPLTVLVSVLIAADLAGILGALLAIPVAGIVKILLRDWWTRRPGARPPEPAGQPEVSGRPPVSGPPGAAVRSAVAGHETDGPDGMAPVT